MHRGKYAGPIFFHGVKGGYPILTGGILILRCRLPWADCNFVELISWLIVIFLTNKFTKADCNFVKQVKFINNVAYRSFFL